MSFVLPRQEGPPQSGGGGPPQSGGGGAGGPGGSSSPQPLLQMQYNAEYSYLYWKVLAGIVGAFIARHVLLTIIYRLRASNQPKSDRAPYPTCMTHVEALANRSLRRVVFGGYRLVDLLGISFVLVWNIVFLLVNTLPPHFVNSGFSSRPSFVAKRAGTIVIWNMPLVFALAGRNNVFTFLTGIETSKLRHVHKWTGRVMFAGGVIHGSLMSADIAKALGTAGYREFLKGDTPRHGIIAVCGLSILAGLSLRPIRQHIYELFLFSHHVGAACFLAGVYLHRPNHRPWVYACMALWSFDWLVRICRILLSHLVYPIIYRDADVSMGRLPARAELVSGAIVMRIPYAGRWHEGQHVFLTFIDGAFLSRPWKMVERHPWSVANVSIPKVEDNMQLEKGHAASEAVNEMLLIIRPKGGITQNLYRLVDSVKKPRTFNVIVDGPYGKRVDSRGYERVLLVAGGSGITHVLSVLLQLVERARTGTAGQTAAVTLVWAIQHLDHVRWIAPYLNQAMRTLPPASSVDFSIELWVTRPLEAESLAVNASLEITRRSSVDLSGKTKGTKKGVNASVLRRDGVLAYLDESVERITTVEAGRPNARTVVEEAVRQTAGSMYLCACGPEGLSRDVQAAAARATKPQQVDTQGRGFIKTDVSKFCM